MGKQVCLFVTLPRYNDSADRHVILPMQNGYLCTYTFLGVERRTLVQVKTAILKARERMIIRIKLLHNLSRAVTIIGVVVILTISGDQLAPHH